LSAHRRHRSNGPPKPKLRKRGKGFDQAPDSLVEPMPEKGPRTERIPEGKLPVCWSPRFLEQADGRFGLVKAVRERVERIKQDSGAESIQQELICSRIGFLSLLLETQETRALEDGKLPESMGTYLQAVNCLVGLLRVLGMEKHVRDAGDLRSYLAERA